MKKDARIQKWWLWGTLAVVLLLFVGCGTVPGLGGNGMPIDNPIDNPLEGGTPTVRIAVSLTDKPVSDVEELWVNLQNGFYVFETAEGNVVWTEPVDLDLQVDLLSLANQQMDWFTIELPEGARLCQIRFTVESATATIAGETFPVEIAGNDSVIKITYSSILVEGDEILLDFDAASSLRKRGSGNGQGQGVSYFMVPVLHSQIFQGSMNYFQVTGDVLVGGTPTSGAVVALFAVGGTEPIRLTVTQDCVNDLQDGFFSLGKVEPGSYEVKVFLGMEIGSEAPDFSSPDWQDTVEVVDQDVHLQIEI